MVRKDMNFTDELVATFPASNPVPPVLRQTMEFLEALGCVRRYRSGGRYMTLHPKPEYNNSAITALNRP